MKEALFLEVEAGRPLRIEFHPALVSGASTLLRGLARRGVEARRSGTFRSG